jgi:hypothetical protein
MVNLPGVFLAALVILLAIPAAFQLYRRREDPNTTQGTIALIAAVLLAVVKVIRSLGLMTNDPLYWTLNISLGVLFSVMFLQFMRSRRGAGNRQGRI